MKYDDPSWHHNESFPPDSPEEYSWTHIALFMKWCFTKGWAGQLHLEDDPEEVQQVIDGTLSAAEFFIKYGGGKLIDECFNAEGNAFAEKYYGDDGLYLDDYREHFGDLMYEAPESAHDFEKFSEILEARLQSGILTRSQIRPWWKFW